MSSSTEVEAMKQVNLLLVCVLRRVRVINMIRESFLVHSVRWVRAINVIQERLLHFHRTFKYERVYQSYF